MAYYNVLLKRYIVMKNIKKLAAFLILGCLIVLFSGCGINLESGTNVNENNETSETTGTTQNQTEIPKLTESELKELLEAEMSDYVMIFFDCADFDFDGDLEAFAVSSTVKDFDGYYDSCNLFYADENGVVLLEEDLFGYPEESITVGDNKFIVWEIFGGGSGSLSMIYGVKDKSPYQPEISSKYGTFSLCPMQDGLFQGETSDFSLGYHDYIIHYFIYDNDLKEFTETKDIEF